MDTQKVSTMENEIIIMPDGARQITGELANRFAYSRSWDTAIKHVQRDRFCVIEPLFDPIKGFTIRASQSTMRGAHSFMSDERVLVYYHDQTVEEEVEEPEASPEQPKNYGGESPSYRSQMRDAGRGQLLS
jgi:hypothetical protein